MRMLSATTAMQLRWGKPGLVKRFRGAQTVELEVVKPSPAARRGARKAPVRLVQPEPVEAAPVPTKAPLSRRQLRNQRRAENDAIIQQLREMFPAGFTEPPVPLAVGLRQQLRAAIPPLATERKLRRAITWWCHSPAYLEAVAAGQERRNIDGTPSGDYPSAEHIAHARKRLGLPVRPVLLPRELRGRATTALPIGRADTPYAHTERPTSAE